MLIAAAAAGVDNNEDPTVDSIDNAVDVNSSLVLEEAVEPPTMEENSNNNDSSSKGQGGIVLFSVFSGGSGARRRRPFLLRQIYHHVNGMPPSQQRIALSVTLVVLFVLYRIRRYYVLRKQEAARAPSASSLNRSSSEQGRSWGDVLFLTSPRSLYSTSLDHNNHQNGLINNNGNFNTHPYPSSSLHDPLGGAEKGALLGPRVQSIDYSTFVPPTKWTEASKQLLPNNTKPNPHRTLSIRLLEGQLVVAMDDAETSSSSTQSSYRLEDLSVHVPNPPEGGVLQLYQITPDSPPDKNNSNNNQNVSSSASTTSFPSSNNTSSNNNSNNSSSNNNNNQSSFPLEHTFTTAFAAAQFQRDLLLYQVVGEQIMNLYRALELVHKGSLAHNGPESVLHVNEGEMSPTPGAVAWDDAMRCLGCAHPFLLYSLERCHFSSNDDNALSTLDETYQNKRAMLGPVDFFRLFCPTSNDPNGLPQTEANPARVESLLRVRKLVAEAAVWVRSYVRARAVVNRGWNLLPPEEDGGEQHQRLAFDDNHENVKHDASAKNFEYYEPTVSRDVQCAVQQPNQEETPQHQPKKKNKKKARTTTQSLYQAYSLVSACGIQLPTAEPNDNTCPLHPTSDPVQAIPSLQKLIRDNPNEEFFVLSFFHDIYPVCYVNVWVRSLPKGVDPAFDTTVSFSSSSACNAFPSMVLNSLLLFFSPFFFSQMKRFMEGTTKYRNARLQASVQISRSSALSSLLWTVVKIISFVWSIFSGSRVDEEDTLDIGSSNTTDRIAFPRGRLTDMMEIHHFGGAVTAPTTTMRNYCSIAGRFRSSLLGTFLTRKLFTSIKGDQFYRNGVVDLTYIVKGIQDDELPERALATIRLVHARHDKNNVPLDVALRPDDDDDDDDDDDFMSTPFSPSSSRSEWADSVDIGRTERSELYLNYEEDAFQEGVRALEDVLRDVTIPCRKQGLSPRQLDLSSKLQGHELDLILPPSVDPSDVVQVPVLERFTSADLRRYFQAENCDLKAAAVRIVESATWRGMTFPIDTKMCRVELHSGQFFHQGFDRRGHPVFYFRNMCAGPWRGEEEAILAAVLHRLETTLTKLQLRQGQKTLRVTLVVLMGKPLFRKKWRKYFEEGSDVDTTTDEDATRVTQDTSANESQATAKTWNPLDVGVNPRLVHPEEYQVHSTQALMRRLVRLLLKHYPERLYKVIIAPGKRRGYGYFGTAVGAQLAVRNNISSARTRSKCFILHRLRELKQFIAPDQLIAIAGGRAPIKPAAFEC